MSEALAKLYRSVIKLLRQAPISHQRDAHKVEFLRNAVVGTPWSIEPFSRVATHQLTFQQLYAELEAAWQLCKESKMAVPRGRAQLRGRVIPQGDSAVILYTGQGRHHHGTNLSRLHPPRTAVLDHLLTLGNQEMNFRKTESSTPFPYPDVSTAEVRIC